MQRDGGIHDIRVRLAMVGALKMLYVGGKGKLQPLVSEVHSPYFACVLKKHFSKRGEDEKQNSGGLRCAHLGFVKNKLCVMHMLLKS